MALTKAIGLGFVAGAGVPLAMRHLTGALGDLLEQSTHHFPVGGHLFYWNWPLFCVVTLVAWGLLKAAESN